MVQVQVKPLGALLLALCMLVPSIYAKSIDVHYCDNKDKYTVKVSGVDISPFPVSRSKDTNFTITASTDKVIYGGKLKIDVSYFIFHVHNENHDLCKETTCPVSIGNFVLSHDVELPGIAPPGSYTLRMTMEDRKKEQLTCITFDFTIGFLLPQIFYDI